AADVNNGSSDNCAVTGYKIAKGTVTAGDASFAASVTFGCGETGPQTVTLQVQDAANNKATCQATVTVSDTTNPTAVCKNITASLSASGSVTVNAADIDNGSTDNCGVTTRLIDGAASKTFTCANKGSNLVTLTVKDAQGNSASCSATVTVADNTKPVVLCK